MSTETEVLTVEPERIAWVVMRYQTVYSTYEVDHTGPGFRVRRLTGVNDPTPRQGPDGQWKEAVQIDVWPDGGLLIHWSREPQDGTLTSPVVSVTPVPVEEILANLPEVGR